jgi:hypothetical protein
MVQAADFWKCDDSADGLYRPRIWRISLQREMEPAAMVIRKVRTQRAPQRLFTKNNHMVQTFSANRADYAFHVSTLPGRPGSAKDFLDIHYCDLPAELLPIDPVSISQQILRCGIEGKGFEHLLRGPFRGRMSRHVEVDNASSIMG